MRSSAVLSTAFSRWKTEVMSNGRHPIRRSPVLLALIFRFLRGPAFGHFTRSVHLPVAVVDGRRTRNRRISVRLWTESPFVKTLVEVFGSSWTCRRTSSDRSGGERMTDEVDWGLFTE